MPLIPDTIPAITCDKNIVKAVPCLSCLSLHDLMVVLVWVLAHGSAYTLPTDTNRLLKDSACMACMSDKELLQAFITILGQTIITEQITTAQLQDQMKCLRCANPKQLKAAVVFLSCTQLTLSEENGGEQRAGEGQ